MPNHAWAVPYPSEVVATALGTGAGCAALIPGILGQNNFTPEKTTYSLSSISVHASPRKGG